jgi:hypothetical protein
MLVMASDHPISPKSRVCDIAIQVLRNLTESFNQRISYGSGSYCGVSFIPHILTDTVSNAYNFIGLTVLKQGRNYNKNL